MARRGALAGALVAVLALVGCAAPPASGDVLARDHQEARTWLYCVFVRGVCYMQTGHDDEDWLLLVRDDADVDREVWVDVSEAVYEAHPAGSHWAGDRG